MNCNVMKLLKAWRMSRAHSPVHSDSPRFPSLHLLHSSFSNPSLALPTSQLILQPFRCFTYITAHSATLLLLLLRHSIFNYVTWRAAHAFEHVLAKALLPKAALLDWSAPGLKVTRLTNHVLSRFCLTGVPASLHWVFPTHTTHVPVSFTRVMSSNPQKLHYTSLLFTR